MHVVQTELIALVFNCFSLGNDCIARLALLCACLSKRVHNCADSHQWEGPARVKLLLGIIDNSGCGGLLNSLRLNCFILDIGKYPESDCGLLGSVVIPKAYQLGY